MDDSIIEHFRHGDEDKAFRLLISTYQERLYHHIRRMVRSHDDTDDILQNTFIKAFKGMGRFRGESRLYSWLYRIATNETYTFLEKRKRTQDTIPFDTSEVDRAENDGPDGDEIMKRLLLAVSLLPEKQQLVFQLKYFEELKYEEISEVTGTSVGALKSSYHIAVKKIEKSLQADRTF
ncbi:MAG: sigma-70 family RNA polymerase sigma factor [Flavobacteriales bacterium]|nr:sigma-70 family RNA polymerase sigma factor [Flavobacteriales bacterium]